MAALTILPLIFLTITPLLITIIPQTLAQTPVAPAPGPAGPVNVTGILDKNGQYTTFIRLLKQTQVGDQVNNQLNGSTEGMTVLAPTDNAFSNLKAGTLNSLNNQEQVQLVLYHVAPKYYSLNDLQSVPNPVRTQATGQNGGVFGLNFTSQGNQVNVSSGMVETQINNALRQQFPLAVYQVDKVLLPEELFEAKSPSEAKAPSEVDKGSPAAGKNSTSNVGAEEPSPAGNGSGGLNVGFGIVFGLTLACMAVLS